MSPTRREVLRTVGSVTALAATSAVAGCNTFQNSNDVHTGPASWTGVNVIGVLEGVASGDCAGSG